MMNAERLLQHFDRLSEAPDAIPCLRRFILDLAVRGKLVEQDPNDEPAAELLKRIQVEKARLVKAEKIRNQEPFESIEESEIPFQIPQTWEWVPATFPAYLISDMGKKVQTKDVLESGEFPVVDQGKVFIRGYCNDGSKVIHIEAPLVLFGDHTRETKLIDFDFVVGADGVKLLHPVGLLTDYYYLALRWLPLDSRGYGRHFKLLRAATLPLPPLAEQYRIVAKVDELMALCDQLEAAKTEREESRDRLVAASLHCLNQPADTAEADTPEAFRDHARFLFNHLPHLITRPVHLHHFREAILELGVTGRLSKQFSSDGNAQLLVDQFRLARRKAKKRMNQSDRDLESLPWLPAGWIWASVDEVAAEEVDSITDGPFGANLKTEHYVQTPGFRVIRLQNIGRGKFQEEHRSYITREHFERLEKHRVFGGDLVVAGLVDPFVRCCEVPLNLGPAVVKADCYRFRVNPKISARFALHYLNSPVAQRFASAHHHGMTLVRIGLGNFRLIPFPLPPLAEQHRIVAKVDELMALCDQLEAQLTTTEADSRRLLEAVLHEALNPPLEVSEQLG